MDPDSTLAHLTKELNLTANQQAQIRPLLVEHQQQEQALHQDQSLSPEELRAKAHAISDQTHKKIESFLTDEQKQKVKAMQERMHRGDQNSQASAPSTPSQP
jgi:Spy/CpxP family protein refolding chaperone